MWGMVSEEYLRLPPRLVSVVKLVVHEARDYAGFANGLVAQENLRLHIKVQPTVGSGLADPESKLHAAAPACILPAATLSRRSPSPLRLCRGILCSPCPCQAALFLLKERSFTATRRWCASLEVAEVAWQGVLLEFCHQLCEKVEALNSK